MARATNLLTRTAEVSDEKEMQESYDLLDLDRLNRMYWHKRMVQLKAELRQPIPTVPLHAPSTSEPRYGQRQGQLRSPAPARSRPVGAESEGQ